jgi:hypothetical protein
MAPVIADLEVVAARQRPHPPRPCLGRVFPGRSHGGERSFIQAPDPGRFATGLLMKETIDCEAPVGYLEFPLGVKADFSLVSLHPYTSVVPGVSVVALVT